MRVAELAELTGITVRTVRYYHAIGLLPVPPARGGWRDYGLVHVARLSRIRWLTEAGVSLAMIGELLAAEPAGADGARGRESVLVDLRATVSAVDEQLARLREQRERLARLMRLVESGAPLTPMAPRAVEFYDRLAAAAADERTRRAIWAERDFVELAYYRGEIPQEAELLFASLDEAGLHRSLAAFGRDPAAVLTDAEIEQLAAGVVTRMLARLGPQVATVARSIDLDRVRRAYGLYLRTVTGGERLIAESVLRRLEAAILQGRAP